MELRHRHPPLMSPGLQHPLARRLAAWIRRFGLDEALAAGEDAHADPLLACRAEQLRSARQRKRLARTLRTAVREADRAVGLTAAAPISPSVRAVRVPLLTLAVRLETDPAVGVRGIAMATQLVTDGASPLFGSSTVAQLEDEIEAAQIGLGC
jgi:hypothetical protein